MASPNSRGIRILVFALVFLVAGLCVWLLVFHPVGPAVPVIPTKAVERTAEPEAGGAKGNTAASLPATEVKTRVAAPNAPSSASLTAADQFSGIPPPGSWRFAMEGTVYGEGAVALPGATVRLFDRANYARGEPLLETQTDSEGHYKFLGITCLDLVAQAGADGYVQETLPVNFGLGGPANSGILKGEPLRQDFHLRAGGVSLRGRVVARATKQPIEGATVSFISPGVSSPAIPVRQLANGRTGQAGEFHLDGLSRYSGALTVSAKGFALASLGNVTPGADPITIELDAGGTRIHGRVVGARSGKPVPNVMVTVTSNAPHRPFLLTVRADSAGRYVTPSLAPMDYVLRAGERPFASFNGADQPISILASSPEEMEVDLTVGEAVEVRGWVLEKDTGKPIAGARVKGAGAPVLTDEQGRFRLESGLTNARSIRLHVEAAGFLSTYPTVEVPDPNTDPPAIKIALERGCYFSGTVTDPQGLPVNGAKVEMMYLDSSSLIAISGSDGRFGVSAPRQIAGQEIRATINARQEGYLTDRFTWPAGEARLERDFQLKAGKELRVTVLDADKKAAADLKVSLFNMAGEGYYPFLYEGNTAADGVVVFHNLPPLQLGVFVNRFQERLPAKPMLVDLAGAESPDTLTVILDPEKEKRVVTGHVTTEDGAPIEGVQATSTWGLNGYASVSTDATGAYRIKIGGDADPMIRFSNAGFEEKFATAKFENDQKTTVLDVTLRRRASIYGQVVDAEGHPLQTTVEMSLLQQKASEGGGGVNAPWFVAVSPTKIGLNEDGGFEIQPARFSPDACYAVRVNDPALGMGQSAWIRADDSRRVGPAEVRLGWHTLTGRVVDAQTGEPKPDAVVTLRDLHASSGLRDWRASAAKFTEPTAFTDTQGRYELAPVPAGEGSVFVYHPDYGIQRFTYTVDSSAGDSTALDLPLRLRVDWTGRILFHDGTEVPRWRLVLVQTDDPVIGWNHLTDSSDSTRPAGSPPEGFHLRPVIPGRAEVRVTLPLANKGFANCEYRWKQDIPEKRVLKEDLRLPPLVAVEMTFPARKERSYILGSLDAGLEVIIQWFSTTEPPSADTAVVYVPPGQYSISEYRNPLPVHPPNSTPPPPPPPPRQVEVTVPPSGSCRIQLP